ncbi:MAG TPA: hydrogenase maturation protease [Candidatus Acidoferrales bacterium]|nr:hydrogenase maturation protease [Candidatus Acidoferrales bacterium]
MPRILVAGLGNIFLGDDGFGVEVVRLLRTEQLPEGVRVADYGLRSLHLAYELTGTPYDLALLVDASSCGGKPGSLYVIEPDAGGPAVAPVNAHSVTPAAVLASIRLLGGVPGRVLVVGCEPESIAERMGLSATVERAARAATGLIRELIQREYERGSNVSGYSGTDRTAIA